MGSRATLSTPGIDASSLARVSAASLAPWPPARRPCPAAKRFTKSLIRAWDTSAATAGMSFSKIWVSSPPSRCRKGLVSRRKSADIANRPTIVTSVQSREDLSELFIGSLSTLGLMSCGKHRDAGPAQDQGDQRPGSRRDGSPQDETHESRHGQPVEAGSSQLHGKEFQEPAHEDRKPDHPGGIGGANEPAV